MSEFPGRNCRKLSPLRKLKPSCGICAKICLQSQLNKYLRTVHVYINVPLLSVPPCMLLRLRRRGHFGIARSVLLSVPWRSCPGYRHAGCLHLNQRPPEMCGLRTRPRTDVDPPRFLPQSNCRRRGGEYRLTAHTGRYLVDTHTHVKPTAPAKVSLRNIVS